MYFPFWFRAAYWVWCRSSGLKCPCRTRLSEPPSGAGAREAHPPRRRFRVFLFFIGSSDSLAKGTESIKRRPVLLIVRPGHRLRFRFGCCFGRRLGSRGLFRPGFHRNGRSFGFDPSAVLRIAASARKAQRHCAQQGQSRPNQPIFSHSDRSPFTQCPPHPPGCGGVFRPGGHSIVNHPCFARTTSSLFAASQPTDVQSRSSGARANMFATGCS